MDYAMQKKQRDSLPIGMKGNLEVPAARKGQVIECEGGFSNPGLLFSLQAFPLSHPLDRTGGPETASHFSKDTWAAHLT